MIKKILINLALVFVAVFLIDFTLGKVPRYYYFKETAGQHFCTTYSMEKTRADVLVFGSSRANHHYVPGVFEDSLKMSFYNTGRDGTGIFYHLAILKAILKRYTPKMIVLDYTGGFEKETASYDRLSVLLPYYKTHPEIRSIIRLKGPFERFKLLSEIYPFNSQILTIAKGNSNSGRNHDFDLKGYIPLFNEWTGKIEKDKIQPDLPLDSNKVNALHEFIRMAKKAGINIFVVSSPVFMICNGRQEFDVCKKICSIEGVPYWNYYKDTLFLKNGRLFQDVGHLNQKGAVIFSKLIVQKIGEELKKENNSKK